MTVTELGMCHYFVTVGNAKAYSREYPRIRRKQWALQKNNFLYGIVGPYTLHTIAA
jgi:hypothetical protein